jgi:hypothetical protein
MMTELSSLFELMSGLGGQCVLLAIGGCVVGVLVGVITGFGLGWFAARPILRWGLGDARLAGCLGTVSLVLGGAVGGLWAGAWGGGALCVRQAVVERFMLEDLAIKGLVEVATDGRSTGDPVHDGRALRALYDEAGGSLQQLLREVEQEMRLESPDAELPEFLKPETVAGLLGAIERNDLFDPEALAAINAHGGFAAALAGRDAPLAAYARSLLDLSEPVRRELVFAVAAAAISNAAITPLLTLGGPFVVLVLVAAVSRLLRQPNRPPRAPLPGRPPHDG